VRTWLAASKSVGSSSSGAASRLSFAPTPGKKFGVSDEHIWAANITARVETSDGGDRVTAARVATLGVFALGAM
jgi:hypothetical protein